MLVAVGCWLLFGVWALSLSALHLAPWPSLTQANPIEAHMLPLIFLMSYNAGSFGATMIGDGTPLADNLPLTQHQPLTAVCPFAADSTAQQYRESVGVCVLLWTNFTGILECV